MDAARIVVVGSYNRDVVLRVARFPAPGETCLSKARLETHGGKGSNQAVQAARCGAAVELLAATGDDAAGTAALALWAAEGIDAAGAPRLADVHTGMATILVDDEGENLIVVDPGANARLSVAHVEARTASLRACALVAAQLETPVATICAAFALAKEAGRRTVLNAAPAPEAVDAALMALTDILVVNAGEGAAMTGADTPLDIGVTLAAQVGEAVVVTLGAEGAMLFRAGRPALSVASPPISPIDTTGAGDAFIGAFCARLAQAGDIETALAWGVAAGALACLRPGAAESFATRADIERAVEAMGRRPTQ